MNESIRDQSGGDLTQGEQQETHRLLESNQRIRPTKLFAFILRRLLWGAVTLVLVSVVVFAATQALPGNAARAILGNTATPQSLALLTKQLHLNRPVTAQYWSWAFGILHGSLGKSLVQDRPVASVIGFRIENSAFLVGIASLIVFPLAILLGSYAAYKRDSLFDHLNALISLSFSALPEFVIAILLVIFLSVSVFHILPADSLLNPNIPVWRQTRDLVLPILTLVIWELPYVSRIMRASMIEVLESEYIEMARLKGLPERRVLWKHALLSAIVPTIHVIAVQIAFLVGSIVAVEYVFGFPGIGQELVTAVEQRDLPIVQGIGLLIASVYVVVNVLADISTMLVTPRLATDFSHMTSASSTGGGRRACRSASG